MSHSTNLEQKEQSSGQDYIDKIHNEEYLNKEIPGALPLRVVGNTTRGYCIVLGKYRISEICETPAEAEAQLIEDHWGVTINIIGVMIEDLPNWKDETK